MSASKQISFDGVHRVLKSLFGDCLHAKRILSLAGATLGAIQSGSLAVALIGQGLRNLPAVIEVMRKAVGGGPG